MKEAGELFILSLSPFLPSHGRAGERVIVEGGAHFYASTLGEGERTQFLRY